MSTGAGSSFAASPRVDITALLSVKSKARPHNGTLCQCKYSTETETTFCDTHAHTHTLRECVILQYKQAHITVAPEELYFFSSPSIKQYWRWDSFTTTSQRPRHLGLQGLQKLNTTFSCNQLFQCLVRESRELGTESQQLVCLSDVTSVPVTRLHFFFVNSQNISIRSPLHFLLHDTAFVVPRLFLLSCNPAPLPCHHCVLCQIKAASARHLLGHGGGCSAK